VAPTRVLIVRGHLATPWELRAWHRLPPERFDVRYFVTRSNRFPTDAIGLRAVRVGALRDRLPAGPLGELAAGVLGDRYLADADEAYAWADVVHAEELSFWFAGDAARRCARHGFRLVQTVWETIPFLAAYRNRHARRYREEVLAATDLFLPATARARDALLLEGVPPERLVVAPPGIDTERFARPPAAAEHHTLLSPGRLVWEKGHQDVVRALAALRRGLVTRPAGPEPRLHVTGSGPEGERLRAHAAELGVADLVTFGSVPYDAMPDLYARASCLVLASLPLASAAYHPFDVPRAFWEEQFGLVFAEALAAGLDVLASDSGAIPEVLDGAGSLFRPGDWMGIARALAAGPLTRPPGARVEHPPELVRRYGLEAAAERLAAAYDRVLAAAA
jgi:glycosyltransferase involved in cell wall biosynthesis